MARRSLSTSLSVSSAFTAAKFAAAAFANGIFGTGAIDAAAIAADAIEDHAGDALGDAADLEAPCCRQEAAAVADDHDRHVGKGSCRVRVAIEAGEVAA